MLSSSYALAMDVGGTNVRAAVVDRTTGEILASHKERHSGTSLPEVTDTLTKAAHAAAKKANVPMDTFDHAGLGVPGPCSDGTVLKAPNLGWTHPTPVAAALRERLGVEVALANDLQLAALGEATFGAARDVDSSVLVFVGSGVGMAFVKDHELVLGERGMAGEWGHHTLVGIPASKKRQCGCGRANCLEAFVGGKSIGKRVAEDLQNGVSSAIYALARARLEEDAARPLANVPPEERRGRVLASIDAGAVEAAVKLGDPYATALWDELGELLGASIANLATTLDPGRIVLGGGVLLNCPLLLQRVERAYKEALFFPEAHKGLLVQAQLGDDAGTVGASQL